MGQPLEGDEDDWNPQSPYYCHGTYTAQKSAGTEYGSAKKVHLISVKFGMRTPHGVATGLDKAVSHIHANNRQRKSIVVVTTQSAIPVAANDPYPEVRAQHHYLSQLTALGVPVVVSAGNLARSTHDGRQRVNIDTIPGTLTSRDIPLINVGSVDFAGNIDPHCQRGPLVSSYAMGWSAKILTLNGDEEDVRGTSYGEAFPFLIMSSRSY